jgi:serine protease AprX
MDTLRKLAQWILIVFVLWLPAAPAVAPAPTGDAYIHPLLRQTAAVHPDQSVRVVIQFIPPATGFQIAPLRAAIEDLGGRVTSDLHFINALAAEMPALSVLKLPGYAPVRAISPDAAVVENRCKNCKNNKRPVSVYPMAVGASRLWLEAPFLTGRGVKVAVVDSGYTEHDDLRFLLKRKGAFRISGVNFTDSDTALDRFGHGTHVAGIIGGNGISSKGHYLGIAPGAEMISVKTCGDDGTCYTSDVIEGLQWIYEEGHAQGIRVVNLSLNSTVLESYHTNPLCAAAEVLWFNNFVVVVSAGNLQDGQLFPPANDPFVITVGSADDQGTIRLDDDVISSFSAYGATEQGIIKPDLVAPGRDLVSLLNNSNSRLVLDHLDHLVPGMNWMRDDYFRISGTSVSAAVVSGAITLLLQDEPDLNPDQVKYRLMATAAKEDRWPGYEALKAGAGYLDIYAAVHGETTETANTGVVISQMLWTPDDWANYGSVNWGTIQWGSVNWGSVNWGTVNWGTVNWGTVNWGTVNWGSDYWGP